MRYNIVLFDADGTLLDFSKSEDEAVRATMTAVGIEPDDGKVAVYSSINDGLWKRLERGEIEKDVLLYRRFEEFCEYYGYDTDTRLMAREYMEQLSQKGYIFDGVIQLLDSLYGKTRMYIVTNGVDYVQRKRYASSGIGKYFDGIFISGEIGFEKPDVRFFEFVSGSVPDFCAGSTLVVGDSLTSDIKGANNFGLDSCWFNPKNKPLSQVALPTYTVNNYDGVYQIINTGDIK